MQTRIICLTCLAGSVLSGRAAFAQIAVSSATDEAPSAATTSDTNPGNVADVNRVRTISLQTTIPSIPYEVLRQVVVYDQSHVDLDLTAEQSAEATRTSRRVSNDERLIREMRDEVALRLGTVAAPFRIALNAATHSAQDQGAADLVAILTPEQIRKVKTRCRSLTRHAEYKRLHELLDERAFGPTARLAGILESGDLLTAVNFPKIQDNLQLSDDQWAAIEELQKLAAADATRLVAEHLIRFPYMEMPFIAGTTEKVAEELNQATRQILNDEQRRHFDEYSSKWRAAVESRSGDASQKGIIAIAATFRRQNRHGAVTGRTEVRKAGKTWVNFELFNLFEQEGSDEVYHLTADQREAIAAILDEARLQYERTERARVGTRNGMTIESRDEFTRLVAKHRRHFHDRVSSVLMDEQKRYLNQERFREIGPGAVLDESVQAAIALSAPQAHQIEEILTRRPELNVVPSGGSAFVASTAQTPQAHAASDIAYRNHRARKELALQQHVEIWNVLSEEQRVRFSELTGIKAPEPLTGDSE
ncbi:MAG: hypothetical protein R3C19_09185 [Planctomycetaceae bacterium]